MWPQRRESLQPYSDGVVLDQVARMRSLIWINVGVHVYGLLIYERTVKLLIKLRRLVWRFCVYIRYNRGLFAVTGVHDWFQNIKNET